MLRHSPAHVGAGAFVAILIGLDIGVNFVFILQRFLPTIFKMLIIAAVKISVLSVYVFFTGGCAEASPEKMSSVIVIPALFSTGLTLRDGVSFRIFLQT